MTDAPRTVEERLAAIEAAIASPLSIGRPEDWTDEQVAGFKAEFGRLAGKHEVRWIPPGARISLGEGPGVQPQPEARRPISPPGPAADHGSRGFISVSEPSGLDATSECLKANANADACDPNGMSVPEHPSRQA